MKKTKFLTCLAALTLLLAGCEVAAENLDSDTTSTESGDTTTSDTGTTEGGDTGTGEGGDTGDGSGDGGDGGDTQETPVTYTYSVEVTNADALKELTFDGNATSQTGVDLTINLVTTASTGDVTTDTASADDVTLTPASEGVIAVSGLTVTPVAAGDTTLTVTWTEGNVSTTANVSVTDVTVNEPDPTPTEPTSWSEYLEANADGDHIAYKATIDAFLDGDLDEIVPYVASEIGYQYILVYEAEGRVAFKVSDSNSGPATNAAAAWKTAITDFGYTDLGSSTYQNEAGYKVEFEDWSIIGDFTVYVYPIEQGQEEPTEPTTWAEYLSAEDKAKADSTLGGDLDDLLPFYAPEGGYTSTNTDSTSGCFYIVYDGSSDVASALDTTWKALLTEKGWTENGSSGYEYYYVNDDGYTIKIVDWSFMGTWYLYIYAPVEETPAASTWDEYITDEVYRGVIAEIFGSVEILDEILPFYIGDTDPDSITAANSVNGDRLIIKYNSAPSGIMDTWVSILTEDGWEQTDHTVSYNETYTFEKDGYTVELNLEFGEFDLYLYPPVDTGDEGGEDLETAQAILDAAAAQTNGYDGFEYLHYDQRVGGGYDGSYYHYMFDLTIDDNNNLYGRYINHDESGSDERSGIQYFYNKYYYYNNNKSGTNVHSAASSLNAQYNSKSGIITGRITGASATYKTAFDNASSIDLANATDFELVTESNGNYKLTFIYNNTWYCYKADTNLNLVGAGYSTNWTDSKNYEIVYGEESTKESLDAIMDVFFADEYWFPKEASDEEIAQEILNAADAADDNGLDWDAFHGEYIDESYDETDTLYLTTDSDGLYGSGICLDDGDPSFEYYYKNGKEYIHNNNWGGSYSINDSDFYYGDTYADILSDFTSDALGDAFLLDLDDDDWTLTTLTDGYELIVETTELVSFSPVATEYVYITDLDYNLLAVAYGVGTTGFDFEGWYAEQATAEQVEASLEDFNPANWGEGDGGDEATPSWADYLTDDNYAKATELLGKTLDEVLPVVLPDGANYAQISVASSYIQFDASDVSYAGTYDYDTLNSAWDDALKAAGWSESESNTYGCAAAYTNSDGYTIEIIYYDLMGGAMPGYEMWMWDLNLYPPQA